MNHEMIEKIVEAVKSVTHNFGNNECDISESDLRTALATLPEPGINLQGTWISVEYRLPENLNSFSNDVVLFWSITHGFAMIGCYDYETNDWTRLPWERGYRSLKFNEVTHWQPLPVPPLSHLEAKEGRR